MKKETIEEAAKKESEYLSDWEDKETWKWGFEEGAKWHQERSYSEEELREAIHESRMQDNETEDYIFEQFKKNIESKS